MSAKLAVGLLFVASCGRVAFDARDDASGSAQDGANGTRDANGNPDGPGGSLALVAHTIINGQVTSSLTTTPIDTTGASLLVIAACRYNSAAALTPGDSATNTWTPILLPAGVAMMPSVMQLFYVAAPVTSTNHVFGLVAADFLALAVLAFSGTRMPNVLDNAVARSGANPLNPGPLSIEAGNLVVTFACSGQSVTTSYAIDSGFTLVDSILNGNSSLPEDIASAYLITAAAGTVDPSWSLPGDTQVVGVNAVFLGP